MKNRTKRCVDGSKWGDVRAAECGHRVWLPDGDGRQVFSDLG